MTPRRCHPARARTDPQAAPTTHDQAKRPDTTNTCRRPYLPRPTPNSQSGPPSADRCKSLTRKRSEVQILVRPQRLWLRVTIGLGTQETSKAENQRARSGRAARSAPSRATYGVGFLPVRGGVQSPVGRPRGSGSPYRGHCAPQSPRAPCSRASIPDLLLSAGRRERPGMPGCRQGTRADCGADEKSSDPIGRGLRPSQRSQTSRRPPAPRDWGMRARFPRGDVGTPWPPM